MRRLKKTLIYLLAMVLCSGIFMVPVLGAVQEQDGIKSYFNYGQRYLCKRGNNFSCFKCRKHE